MSKKANHQVNIVAVTEIKPHLNADNLEIIPVGEYQVIVRKGDFKVGDLAVYIQPDSIVPLTEPFRFIWGPYVTCSVCSNGWDFHKMSCYSGYDRHPEIKTRHRRITVKRYRGERSEGLLLPVSDFTQLSLAGTDAMPCIGDDVSDLLGIM